VVVVTAPQVPEVSIEMLCGISGRTPPGDAVPMAPSETAPALGVRYRKRIASRG